MNTRTLFQVALFISMVACQNTDSVSETDDTENQNEDFLSIENKSQQTIIANPSLQAVVNVGCTTSVAQGLSEQLVQEIQCLAPNALVRVSTSNRVDYGPAVFPYLQSSAARSLIRAQTQLRSPILINSMYRTLAQQWMLSTWHKERKCNITLAATPGQSPHERGLSIDVSEYAEARRALEANGWKWHGPGDLPHFDYPTANVNLSTLSVRAFQKLWNRNNPRDRIGEDGSYGPQTELRLKRSPAGGFRGNVPCRAI